MSSPKLHIVRARAEFDAVVDSQWAAWAQPVEEFWDCWFPTDIGGHHDRPCYRLDAVTESKERLWSEHISDPFSTWLYIVDEEEEEEEEGRNGAEASAPYVLASCQWRVYPTPTNPFAAGAPDLQCPAWPVGSEGARFTAKFARSLFQPRVVWMARPHVGLSWMAVRPEARRRGLGSVLMSWGIEQADSLGIETFIEGTSLGNLLYQSNGFHLIRKLHIDMTIAEQDSEWEALKRRYHPNGRYVYHALWRPVRGIWVSDDVDRTWQERFELWDASKGSDGEFVVALD